jgi:hypothetical protein
MAATAAPAGDRNADESEERRTIAVDSRSTPVATTMDQITEQLLATGSCFNRVEKLVVVREQSISPILSSAELTGLLNQHVEFYFVSDEGGEYKPLPPAYANTWLITPTALAIRSTAPWNPSPPMHQPHSESIPK